MTTTRTMQEQHFDVPKGASLESLSEYGEMLATMQRAINWWVGDVALRAESRFPETHHQVWPEWISPGLVARCKAVSAAYKPEQRNIHATWSQHMAVANDPDRIELLEWIVSEGMTSDQAREAIAQKRKQATEKRWLLAVDVNYFLHRTWFSGAENEAAAGVSSWIERTVERLKEKGLTDVVCCFDSKINHRKQLTADWDDKYKDRPPKPEGLGHQLQLVEALLERAGFCCVKREGMEADDVMASYASQFEGNVTLMTCDKDVRQCLSEQVNMLLDVEWQEDPTSGQMLPEYRWLSAKGHTEETGIPPSKWTEFQTICGDTADGIKGAVGIGPKGAADLIQEYGSASEAIAAAKRGDVKKNKQREALVEFEPKLETTRQLVTLRTDLKLPETTRV